MLKMMIANRMGQNEIPYFQQLMRKPDATYDAHPCNGVVA